MIPIHEYMGNLWLCAEFKPVAGSVVECGTWRGGMSAGMAEILGPDRQYFLFDSFEGLPDAKPIDGESAIYWQKNTPAYINRDNLKTEMSFATRAMQLSKTPKYQIIKGWFSDTLPGFKSEKKIAILRLDGDWYESTMECLTNLYPQVVQGGLILIDDYYAWDGCSKAVHDYLSANKLTERIHQGRGGVCYLVKR